MAKCLVCNSRKGKRECKRFDGNVCSLCCGKTRNKEECEGCQYFKEDKPKRYYNNIPRYTTEDMEMDLELQEKANAIEGALVTFDNESGNDLTDATAIRILEGLLDIYYFEDESVQLPDELSQDCLEYLQGVVESDLEDTSTEELVKILGVVRFVARRRNHGGRDHLSLLATYVGPRVGKGVRLMQMPNDSS